MANCSGLEEHASFIREKYASEFERLREFFKTVNREGELPAGASAQLDEELFGLTMRVHHLPGDDGKKKCLKVKPSYDAKVSSFTAEWMVNGHPSLPFTIDPNDIEGFWRILEEGPSEA